MTAKHCAMCVYRLAYHGKTFCAECYHENKKEAELIKALYGEKGEIYVRPEWLKFMEANAEKEKRRLVKERTMAQHWYD